MQDKRLLPYLNEIRKYRMSIPAICDDEFEKPEILIQTISNAVREFTKFNDIRTRVDLKYLHSICYQINDCLMSDQTIPVALEDIRRVVEKKYGKLQSPNCV
jgi:hypothetical protein